MIDVALQPAAARAAEVTVVVDTLRATSTAVQALAAGYERVLCVDSIERAAGLRGPGRVLAGERGCARPPGFELGNSPADTIPPRGRELVLATTNGAPAVVAAAARSEVVLLGCLLNLDALVAQLGARRDVLVVCAGTDGEPALEDVYVAGRICVRLPGPRTDAARIAEAVAGAHPSARVALDASEDARRLVALGLGEDVTWCARESTADAVPHVTAARDGVASVRDLNVSLSEHDDILMDVSVTGVYRETNDAA